ncbi:alpha/beta fold hydrolase [Staphylococcus pseudintermedius]
MVKQISYGAHEDQHYDVYDNEQKTSQAWIVLIHGGYWRQKYSKAMMDLMIDTLIEAGYAVVNVEYRRGTAHPWPIPSDDVAAAIQHFKTYTYQPRQLVGIGHSVGGQLVLLNAKLFDQIVALAPVTDVLYTLHQHLGQDAAAEYFDSSSTHTMRAASLLMQAPIDVDTLIVHGFNDTSVHMDTTLSYVQENYKHGQYLTLYALPYLDHLDCINPGATHLNMLLEWLAHRTAGDTV